jgi:hypothetical protein
MGILTGFFSEGAMGERTGSEWAAVLEASGEMGKLREVLRPMEEAHDLSILVQWFGRLPVGLIAQVLATVRPLIENEQGQVRPYMGLTDVKRVTVATAVMSLLGPVLVASLPETLVMMLHRWLWANELWKGFMQMLINGTMPEILADILPELWSKDGRLPTPAFPPVLEV